MARSTQERQSGGVALGPIEYQMRFKELLDRAADEGAAALPGREELGPYLAVSRQAGSGGAVSPSADADVVIEDDQAATINFLAPNAYAEGLLFGDPDNSAGGWVLYDNSADLLRLGAAGDNTGDAGAWAGLEHAVSARAHAVASTASAGRTRGTAASARRAEARAGRRDIAAPMVRDMTPPRDLRGSRSAGPRRMGHGGGHEVPSSPGETRTRSAVGGQLVGEVDNGDAQAAVATALASAGPDDHPVAPGVEPVRVAGSKKPGPLEPGFSM